MAAAVGGGMGGEPDIKSAAAAVSLSSLPAATPDAQEPSAPVASWPRPEGSYTQRIQERTVEAESQILDRLGFLFKTGRKGP